MQTNKIRWDVIEQLSKEHGMLSKTFFYGLPEVTDPVHTAVATDDVIVQPKWDISDKVVISTAVVGSFYSKNGNPNQPITPDEIYNSAREAILAGAPIIHIHVRNEDGYNRLDPKLFNQVIGSLKKEFPDVMFDCCLVPRYEGDWERMLEMLDSKLIDVTPINTTATYCGDMLLTKAPHIIIQKARLVQEHGIIPQIAVYSDGDIDNADRWLFKTGLVETGATGQPSHWLILADLPGGSPMPTKSGMVETFMHLHNRIKEIDKDAVIMVCASGRASSYLATLAVLMGCHIRVGMEDTVWKWPHKDDKIENNAKTFLDYKQLCALLGREVASPNDYRKLIGLPLK
ncbi:3-keto-5-aminohexanoate cleavage protein [Fusibacter paucivorans]|uniref:3-keto-5-aminohexanoate cleavage protein n=1 Tax=Fusibacter paucivorans TaxID=76009 RepID=A0ABS5PQ33_9FIRM|nr:3-keto-5-aminohexanoate cleavage protein [Fusibacter paucivorans]MBS7527273.1 3-keto-5-aminohexanoate cleavage protein [Fusibacter paucivorans]